MAGEKRSPSACGKAPARGAAGAAQLFGCRASVSCRVTVPLSARECNAFGGAAFRFEFERKSGADGSLQIAQQGRETRVGWGASFRPGERRVIVRLAARPAYARGVCCTLG